MTTERVRNLGFLSAGRPGCVPRWNARMKLTVKDLAGKKTEVEVEPSITVADVKSKLEQMDASMEASRQRLIFKGKVLKDDVTVESTGVTENDFFVCMINKPKAAPKPSAPAPAPSVPATAVASGSSSTPAPPSTASAPAPAPPAPVQATPAAVDPAQVASLVEFGFPEANVRAALAASGGNPDMAYALLESGQVIPPPRSAAPAPSATSSPGAAPGAIRTLEGFRSHPQFNQLRRLVQQNPESLDQVLALIGQQSPDLLQVIMQQQDDFIAMMNEPVTDAHGPAPAPGQPNLGANPFGAMLPGMGADLGLGGEGMDQGPSPQQLATILQAMPEPQRNQLLSALMGVPADQVGQFSQQLIQALASGAAPGMGALGGVPPGATRIQLTEEEAANLNQLVAMGFDRQEALQVFLACDKNVEMAASMLFDSLAEGGGNAGGRGSGGDQSGSGDGTGDDQMY